MKLLTYKTSKGTSYGAVTGQGVIDLGRRLGSKYPDLKSLIAADAFKRAKATDPKTLAEAIRQTNITEKMTLGAPIKFNAKGQVEGIGSACVQNLNLTPTVVLPKGAATAKPVFPVPGYKKA